jgi:hypothetical protein
MTMRDNCSRRHAAAASCCFALMLMAGAADAQQHDALHVDFNADVVGETPSTDPPGDPDGDSLRLSESGGSVRVEESYGDLTDQPCVVRRQRSGYDIYLRADLDPDMWDCSWYKASWRSLVSEPVGFFYLGFYADNRQALASLEYRGSGTHTLNGSGNVISVGFTPMVSQFFELEMDLTTKTVNLSIDGTPVPDAQGTNFVQNNPDGLRIVITGFGMADLYDVAIDDLQVIAMDCPGVPTVDEPWGSLKAMYR